MIENGRSVTIERKESFDVNGSSVEYDVFGPINPILNRNKTEENKGQDLVMFLLTVLTNNKYSRQMGYPDPLIKAHENITSIKDDVKRMIKGSSYILRKDPLKFTRRELRG
ncbi:MAG: hypothetical protein ACFFDI_32300 [Promethearchaeota archaeon]